MGPKTGLRKYPCYTTGIPTTLYANQDKHSCELHLDAIQSQLVEGNMRSGLPPKHRDTMSTPTIGGGDQSIN